MRFLYTPEMEAFIQENLPKYPLRDLTALVNERFGLSLTESAMKSYKTNRKLRSGRKGGNPKGFSNLYPPEVQTFLQEHHYGIRHSDLTELVNAEFGTDYTVAQITAFCKNRKLSNGVDTRFKPGGESLTKGKHIRVSENSRKTQFKAGGVPHNAKPIGRTRVHVDGYLEIKTQEGHKNKNYSAVHRLVWEEHNGPIPKGSKVVFLDGDKMNFDISNLALLTGAELQFMNMKNLFSTDPEVTKAGIAIARLYTTARKLERNADAGKTSAE